VKSDLRSKQVLIPRIKELHATHFTSSFYSHVSKQNRMARSNARSLLRRTYVDRKRLEVSGRARMVARYMAKIQANVDAFQRGLCNNKGTGDSDD
jgi:hypothetical protein